MLHLQYFGQAFFKVWNEDVAVVMDPYTDIGYPMPEFVEADVVSISHSHYDHNNPKLVKNASLVIREAGEYTYKDVVFDAYPVFHDEVKGKERGSNLLLRFTLENRVFVHCGDLGHLPSEELLEHIVKPDVLMIPVGGRYTINAKQAHQVVEMLQPTLVIPMHYKTKYVDIAIAHLQDYLQDVTNAVHFESDIIELDQELFHSKKTITVHYQ